MSRRLIPLFLALLVGAGGCDLQPITTQPPGPQQPGPQQPGDPQQPERPTVPSALGAVEAHAEPGAVTLSWSPPENPGGSALTGYVVRSEPLDTSLTIQVEGTTARVTQVREGTTYRFTVSAANAQGEGPAGRSNAVTVPTLPGAPSQPSVVPGDGQVRVSWTEPDSEGFTPITGYLVTVHPQGLRVTVDASTRSTVVEGLSNGEASTFTVRAINAVGEGPESPSSPWVAPATLPSSPASFEVTSDYRQATLTWSAPESLGGSAVQAYVITIESTGYSTEVDAQERSFAFTGLFDGATYSFTLAARNGVGTGPKRSATVRIPDVPSQPGEVRATAGTRSATVTWEAPAGDGGKPLTGYVVEASPSGAQRTVDAQTRSATFTNLSSTQAYTFTVVATNRVGSSFPSTPSAAVRPLPAPVEVMDFQVSASDAGCLEVSYDLRQPDGLRADVTVEVDAQSNGTFERATQASGLSPLGLLEYEGLLARPTSPGGLTHQFLWNRAFDVPGTATVRVRLSARVPGTPPVSSTRQVTLPAAARRCEVRLPTSTVHPLSGTPYKVVNGDFNADGRPDLAVAFESSDTVSFLLGLGNGSFQAPLQQKFPYDMKRLTAGDLDGDGADELLWQDGARNLWVARNHGNGLFAPPVSYFLGISDLSATSYSPIAIADFDGNGSLDVATLGGSNSSPTLGILANAGDGTLGAFTSKANVPARALLEVADLDEDGRQDVLAIAGGTSVALLSNGDGSFRSRLFTTPSVHSLAVGDLDGDGHLDLVLAYKDSDLVRVHRLQGDGQGGFAAAQLVDTLTDLSSGMPRVALAAVDLDRDGLRDLMVGLEWEDTFAVLRGKGGGTFAPAMKLPAGRAPVFATTRDFDGDGLEDVATVQNFSRDVRVWRNSPETLSLPGGVAGALAEGDFNGDGRMDVVSGSAPDKVQVHLAGGPEGLKAQAPVSVGGFVYQVVVGHVDEDATLDVVVVRGEDTPSSLALLLGNGDGTLRRAADISVGAMPGHVALGDVNGDGRLDIACQVTYFPEPSYSIKEIRLLLGQGGGTFAPPTLVQTSPTPDALALGDLDRDGALDMVVAQDAPGGGVLLLKGRGDGTFLPALLASYQAGQYNGHIALADLNGDGWLDVVRSNTIDNKVHVLLGWGGWTGWMGEQYDAGGNCFFVSVRDFDADGRQDVLCANPGKDSVSLLRGKDSGRLAAPQVFGVRTGVHELGVLDVNADGRLDIVTGGSLSMQGTLLLQP